MAVESNSNASCIHSQSDKQTNSATSLSSGFNPVQTQGCDLSLSQSCQLGRCSENTRSQSAGRAVITMGGPPRTPSCFFNVVPTVSQAPNTWPTVSTHSLTSQVGIHIPKKLYGFMKLLGKVVFPTFLKQEYRCLTG